MSPTINVDDLVLIKRTNKIKEGDIISYKEDNSKYEILHRVIKINNNKIITKGDANNKEDKPINKKNITGVYITKIKYLNHVVRIISSKKTLIIVLIIFIGLLLLNIKSKNIIYILLIILIININNNYSISKFNNVFQSINSIKSAKWEVKVDDSMNNRNSLNLIAGNNVESYSLKLTNNSEIKAKYTIAISNIPNYIEVKLDDGNYTRPINNTMIFDSHDSIPIEKDIIHTLHFKTSIDSDESINNIKINVNFIEEV